MVAINLAFFAVWMFKIFTGFMFKLMKVKFYACQVPFYGLSYIKNFYGWIVLIACSKRYIIWWRAAVNWNIIFRKVTEKCWIINCIYRHNCLVSGLQLLVSTTSDKTLFNSFIPEFLKWTLHPWIWTCPLMQSPPWWLSWMRVPLVVMRLRVWPLRVDNILS